MGETKVIFISVDRYNELLKKETVYDLYRNKLENDSFASELDKTLFGINKEKDDF